MAPRIAYYGDDFTGATDTLATATQGGLRTLLFLRVPTPEMLAAAGDLDCIGIAGASRSMTPADMESELRPVAECFAQLGAPVVHYKTCSTFDSSPQSATSRSRYAFCRRRFPAATSRSLAANRTSGGTAFSETCSPPPKPAVRCYALTVTRWHVIR